MRVIVVGAGIAGAAVCRALSQHDVVLLDREGVGAKSPPAALLHAIPGRSFDREPIEWEAFEVAMNWLRASNTPMVEAKMVRPLEGRGGERLLASYERVSGELPGWLEHRHVAEPRPQIEYSPAFSVDMRALATEWAADASFMQGEVHEVEPNEKRVKTTEGFLHYDRLIVATGADVLLELPPMRVYAGDLMTSAARTPDHMISAGGHAAPMAGEGVSVGATVYEQGKSANVDQELEALLRRVGRWAALPPRETFEVWHGQRATVADRFPILNEVSADVLAVNSLGSRGLYWAPYLAECTSRWIKGIEPPPRFGIERLP